MIVTMSHVSGVPGYRPQGGFCAPGLRRWCRQHGIDLRAFVRNGIEEERLVAIGDEFALAVLAHARRVEGVAHG